MSASPYQGLLGAAIPRPKAFVDAYVERGTSSHEKTVWIFVAIFVVLWFVAGSADASGGHSSSVLASFAKSFAIMAPLSMLLIGPVLLFWSSNKSGLAKHLRYGAAQRGRERSRDVFHIRGTSLIRLVVEYSDGYGRVATARFELPEADAPAPGTELCVLHKGGTTAAVLWPDEGVALARVTSG